MSMQVRSKIVVLGGSIMFFALASLAIFYMHFEMKAHAIIARHQLSSRYANGVKHAYTAAYTYHTLSKLGVSPHYAQSITLYLGMGNEYLERIVNYHQPDSMKEIMKDMHNNQAGIAAVRWQEAHHHLPTRPHYASIEAMIGRMATELAILPTEKEIQPTHPIARSIDAAYDWANVQQEKIARNVHRTLMLPQRSLAQQEKEAHKPSS
jgi:hypothetical protein